MHLNHKQSSSFPCRYRFVGGDFPIGDAYKLYWHFDRYEKNGIIGIFITVFLYVVTVFTASTILYMYFLRVHNSGRLLDVYHRLNGREDQFFVPYDLELSLEELTYICRKAEQWRGEEGERRKVAVYDYVWEEEEVRNPGNESFKCRKIAPDACPSKRTLACFFQFCLLVFFLRKGLFTHIDFSRISCYAIAVVL